MSLNIQNKAANGAAEIDWHTRCLYIDNSIINEINENFNASTPMVNQNDCTTIFIK